MIVIADAATIFSGVWRTLLLLWIAGTVSVRAADSPAGLQRPEGRVHKVLPHLLDAHGQHTVSPSLFDRDAYQAYLRRHPAKVTGIRYDVRWTAKQVEDRPLTLRLELLGMYQGKQPRQRTLEKSFSGRSAWRQWTGLELTGEDYTGFGQVTAWRVTLWCGDELLDEYKSFLW